MMKIHYNLIQVINRIIPTTLFALWSLVSFGLPVKNDSLRFEILLTQNMFSDIQTNEKFINSLEITSGRNILISTTNKFYLLGWGGIDPVGKNSIQNISSFAYTPDGFLVIVRNKELCSMDSVGNLSRLIGLPDPAMGISAGKYIMYIYDRSNPQNKYTMYILAKGGKYTRLFEVAAPINSAVEWNNKLLFTSGSSLFSFDIKNKEMKAVVALKKDLEIKSLTVNTAGNIVYLSTATAIYALKDSSMVTITNEFGGILRYYDDGLIVFNPEKQLLIRIVGIENEIASKMLALKAAAASKPAYDVLTNESIINFVKAELSDDLIIKIINKSKVNFDVSINAMIELSNQNVPSTVISAMKTAMKRKTSN